MTQPILKLFFEEIKFLLTQSELEGALEILKREIAPISKNLSTSIILLEGQYKALKTKQINKTITDEKYDVEVNKLKLKILTIPDEVPNELRVKEIMGKYTTPIYTTNSEEHLEKIQGPENNLVSMSWIYKCIKVSKSVCQVIRRDGEKGTGWMLQGGWVMTNFHVIPNKRWVEGSRIIFDYEEDLFGNTRETSSYDLDPEGALFSSLLNLDYAFIKVKDNPQIPISKWGYIEVDNWSDPQPEQTVNIIQHPKGGTKQIALTKNQIINVDGKKIFYMTDTEKGSSGSPVLNNEWKVIALHHAGVSEEDGGLVVNSETGEKRGANEGISIKHIMEDIQMQRTS